MSNKVIIYSVGQTHQIYINVTEEEAAKRWQEIRANRNVYEVAYEEAQGYEVKRSAFEFNDEFMIWGGAAEELNSIASALMTVNFASRR